MHTHSAMWHKRWFLQIHVHVCEHSRRHVHGHYTPPPPPPPSGVVSYAQASRDLEKKQASCNRSGSIMILNYNTNVYQLWLYAMSQYFV